jgi:hypothetical protein
MNTDFRNRFKKNRCMLSRDGLWDEEEAKKCWPQMDADARRSIERRGEGAEWTGDKVTWVAR